MATRSRSIVLLCLLALLLVPVACAALVPGYAEEKARLEADAQAARAARHDAEAALAQATKAGDAQAIADALDRLSVAIEMQIDALASQAKHEVASAANAGSGIAEVVTGLLGGGGLLAGLIAQRRATQAATGPSRAQAAVDEQWDQIVDLKAQLAELRGRAEIRGVAPAPAAA